MRTVYFHLFNVIFLFWTQLNLHVNPRCNSHRSSGFTLLELLLVIAVIAILASMAVPNYQRLMARRAVDQATLQLRDHIELARTYAQAHQIKVEVCPVTLGQLNTASPVCNGQSQGWQAWVVKTAGGVILARSQPFADGLTIDSGDRDRFVFNERGGANGYNGSVVVQNSTNQISKTISIAADGRIQTANSQSNNSLISPKAIASPAAGE